MNIRFGTGRGISADEIVTGFLSADRIEAGSITTNKLAAEVGEELNLESNRSIRMTVVTPIYKDMNELVGYRVEITSPVDILSNDAKSTILRAQVWHGSNNVTDEFEESAFNWKRYSNNTTADEAWNNDHKGMKSIQITCADVDYSATYECELLGEET